MFAKSLKTKVDFAKVIPENCTDLAQFGDSTMVSNDKPSNSKMKKYRKLLIGAIIVLVLISIAFGVYFGVFYQKEYKYKPPEAGTVINVGIISSNSTSDSRFLSDNATISTSYTFIIVSSSSSSMELLAAPGIVDEMEILKLRSLSDTDENSDEQSNSPQIYIAQVDLNEGKISSLKKPENSTESQAQETASAINMAVINVRGEEKAKKGDLSANDCETYGDVLYCPTFTSEMNDEYVILKASYDGSSFKGNRRLEDDDPLLISSNVTIEKNSYIRKDTGSLEKSEVNGTANINIVDSENATDSASFSMNNQMSAEFKNSNFSLSKDEAKNLKNKLEKTNKYDEVDLAGNKSYTIEGDHHDNSTTNSSENRELSLQDHGRNLGISVNEKVYLLKVLGVEVYLKIKMTEKSDGSLGAATSLSFGSIFNVPLAEQVYGGSFLKKFKQIINLKNVLEEEINNIKNIIDDYVSKTVGSFNIDITIKIAELQSFLVIAETKLDNSMKGLENTASNYIDQVMLKTGEFKQNLEDQISQTQDSLKKIISELEILNSFVSEANQLKEQLENELHEAKTKLDDFKSQLPNLEEEKEKIISEIEKNAKELIDYEELKKNYEDIRTQIQIQIDEINEIINTIAIFIEDAKEAIEILNEEIDEVQTYIDTQINNLKQDIENAINELNEKLEDVEKRIDEEVIKATEDLEKMIDDLQIQIDDIENQLKTASEDQINLLLEQKAQIESQIEEYQNKINTDIAIISTELNAQKDQYLEELNAQYKIAEDEFIKQLNYWSGTSKIYINQINIFLEKTEDIKSQLSNEKEQLENDLSIIVSCLTLEKEDLKAYYEDLKVEIESQILNKANEIEEVVQINSKINSVLEIVQKFFDDAQSQLLKTKEEIENEVLSLKSSAEENLKDLENRIKLEVTDIRNEIELEIQNKLQEIDKAIEESEKALIQLAIDELNAQLEEIAKLEQDLLAQKQEIENSIEDMKNAYLYMLEKGSGEYKEMLLQAKDLYDFTSNKLQEFSSTLSQIESFKQDISDTIENAIKPLVSEINEAALSLESQANAIVENIENLNTQIYQITESTLTIEFNITQICTNITSMEDILVEKNKNIEELESVFKNFISTQDLILSGSYSWSNFFTENNLLNVRNIIEDSLITPLNEIYNSIITLKDISSSLVSGFKTISSDFLNSSKNKASKMASSSNNIESLVESDTVKSGTKVFDFSVFENTIDSVVNQYNFVKNTFSSISELVTNGVTDDLKKIANIANPVTWKEKIEKIIVNFKNIEDEFKIILDYGDVTDIVISHLESKFSNEMNSIMNGLAIANDLTAIVSDFSTGSLSSILSSKTVTKTLLTIFGPESVSTKNLLSYSRNYNIKFPRIPTPIGSINVCIIFKFGARIDLKSTTSLEKIGFEILPSANLYINAGAEWNFLIAKIGVGASLSSSVSLPVETGISFIEGKAYVQGQFITSISGKAGLYLRWLKIKIVRKCWRVWHFKICIWYPKLQYSKPWYFLYASYDSQNAKEIIPHYYIST
ncbi:hypothetical protein SteCoe_37537 [Stentor coeruleus]|uniref:Uncharacterized protein n=1 Tax=Stentor coeruleus TaxID=5963 RepID=A0A1R2AMU1_9CILI|nr:hypothetical protein SteCoe_37537 [Stentor coeruleus]